MWFPQVGRFCGSPPEIKGFFGQPVTVAKIFFGDYGYPMGTLKSQTHFKIGDASLFKERFQEISIHVISLIFHSYFNYLFHKKLTNAFEWITLTLLQYGMHFGKI